MDILEASVEQNAVIWAACTAGFTVNHLLIEEQHHSKVIENKLKVTLSHCYKEEFKGASL